MSAPARRGLLAAVSALALAPPAATASPAQRRFGVEWSGPIPPTSDGLHPDAALIAASVRFIAARDEAQRVAVLNDDPRWDAVMDDADAALDFVVETPARTAPGFAAKARAIRKYIDGERVADEALNLAEAAADALIADALRLIGGEA